MVGTLPPRRGRPRAACSSRSPRPPCTAPPSTGHRPAPADAASTCPTYAPSSAAASGPGRPVAADATGLGLTGAGHPLLGAVTPLAGSGGLVSPAASLRAPELPAGTALDLALHAGDGRALGELTEETPLDTPGEALRLQVTLGAEHADGSCPVAVHSRPADAGDATSPGPGTPPASSARTPASPRTPRPTPRTPR
ncbi:hypothetical protein LT493_00425 [Streptomyces tricolor]|nr:hypothetical protein [Streptomyces tricolor]